MFSKTVEYALRAALWLAASPSEPATAERIAIATKVPVGYMSKVLNALVRAGVVTSQRGPSGGFVLAHSPTRVTMLDVVVALEPFPRIDRCPLGLPEHADHLCSLHATLDGLAEVAEQTLKSRTLASLLSPGRGKGGCDTCLSGECPNRCAALQVTAAPVVVVKVQQPESQLEKNSMTSSPSVPPDAL
ncbi:MAG: Rrf2 family transcriptional regulator [Phycisphaerales bacterium]